MEIKAQFDPSTHKPWNPYPEGTPYGETHNDTPRDEEIVPRERTQLEQIASSGGQFAMWAKRVLKQNRMNEADLKKLHSLRNMGFSREAQMNTTLRKAGGLPSEEDIEKWA